MSDPTFLAGYISRAVAGPVWHADSLGAILADVTHAEAAARPIPEAHTIAELVAHLATWADAARERLEGKPGSRGEDENFPVVDTSSPAAWAGVMKRLADAHAALSSATAAQSAEALAHDLPGRDHSAAFMLHGVVEHAAYHGGQIALLKKVIRAQP
jgi:uncharacterized damage-inducible protein DinB